MTLKYKGDKGPGQWALAVAILIFMILRIPLSKVSFSDLPGNDQLGSGDYWDLLDTLEKMTPTFDFLHFQESHF